MDNDFCTPNINEFSCFNCCSSFFEEPLQDLLDAPLPWIGRYITLTSMLCSFAVLHDAFYGFTTRKLWFPSKYFGLNSFTLTLLAVAMKLPTDLTDVMSEPIDKLARVTSLVLMSVAMANFMTSLGSMGNNEILLNISALGILVITVVVNVCIRVAQIISFDGESEILVDEVRGTTQIISFDGKQILVEEIACIVVMILLFLILCSLSIMVPTVKKHIESAYQKVHRKSAFYKQVEWGSFDFDGLRTVVRRYSVMAQTGSPQFVITRSVICVIPGIMSLLMASLVLSRVASIFPHSDFWTSSKYESTITSILITQSIFVAVASVAPVFRWFAAAILKSREIGHKSLKDELVVETYWTQMMLDWKTSLLPPIIARFKATKIFVHNARKLLVNFCFGVHVVIVWTSKLLLLISAICAKIFSFCSCFCKESRDATEQDISHPYALQLDDEGKLSERTLRILCKEVDDLIKLGKGVKAPYLIKLLEKSEDFNGVRAFDSKQIQSLHSHQEPPYCWSLPIVTLTTIAIALPIGTSDHRFDQLVQSVSKGLEFVKVIEEALYRNGEFASARNASDVVWVGVELDQKWHHINTKELRLKQSYKDSLQKLSDEAEKKIEDFRKEEEDFTLEDPRSWPIEVISANAMYRISQTIMQANEDNNSQRAEQMFERLSVVISSILSACLTNLGRAITLKCRNSAIDEREKSVRQAARLLGESEEIFKTLQKRVLPKLDGEKAAYIEEWRTFMEQDSENPVASVPTATGTISNSDGEHVIELEG